MTEVTELYDVVDGAVVLRVHAQPGAGRSAGHRPLRRRREGPGGGAARRRAGQRRAASSCLATELGLKPADVDARRRATRAAAKRFRSAASIPTTPRPPSSGCSAQRRPRHRSHQAAAVDGPPAGRVASTDSIRPEGPVH